MKTFNKIVIGFLVCLFIYIICFIPIPGNYKVNNINDTTKTMNITYMSLVPFIKKDTIVKCPVFIQGKVIEHKRFNTNKGYEYLTITNIKGVNYVFEDEKTWKYIEMNAKDSIFICEERFWPEHDVTTIPN